MPLHAAHPSDTRAHSCDITEETRIKREPRKKATAARPGPARMDPDLPSAAACVYLLGGNPLGQKLVSLRQRGQNFIFPVHERSPAVQSSTGGIRSDGREPSADSGGRGAQSLGPPEETRRLQIPGSKVFLAPRVLPPVLGCRESRSGGV